MTLCVEKVPVGKNRLVRVSHDHDSPPLESADVLLKKRKKKLKVPIWKKEKRKKRPQQPSPWKSQCAPVQEWNVQMLPKLHFFISDYWKEVVVIICYYLSPRQSIVLVRGNIEWSMVGLLQDCWTVCVPKRKGVVNLFVFNMTRGIKFAEPGRKWLFGTKDEYNF